MKNNEIWKDIDEYEGIYQVSNLGRIKSLARITIQKHLLNEKILVPCDNGNGYLYINLYKNQKPKRLAIHRLVAKAFIENKNNYNVVNHKDSNTYNNQANNLEWCNQSYNLKYEYIHNNRKLPKTTKVEQLIDNKVINTYISQHEASRQTGIAQSNIFSCLSGKQKTAGGYQWRYVNEK